mmetsp:Transcript_7305/g.21579  ORF Transcript_7305/g.21579 Transcript_7305/m.21579 type:complete len:223 (+) Transcript_7305:209-877(+)
MHTQNSKKKASLYKLFASCSGIARFKAFVVRNSCQLFSMFNGSVPCSPSCAFYSQFYFRRVRISLTPASFVDSERVVQHPPGILGIYVKIYQSVRRVPLCKVPHAANVLLVEHLQSLVQACACRRSGEARDVAPRNASVHVAPACHAGHPVGNVPSVQNEGRVRIRGVNLVQQLDLGIEASARRLVVIDLSENIGDVREHPLEGLFSALHIFPHCHSDCTCA